MVPVSLKVATLVAENDAPEEQHHHETEFTPSGLASSPIEQTRAGAAMRGITGHVRRENIEDVAVIDKKTQFEFHMASAGLYRCFISPHAWHQHSRSSSTTTSVAYFQGKTRGASQRSQIVFVLAAIILPAAHETVETIRSGGFGGFGVSPGLAFFMQDNCRFPSSRTPAY